MYEPANPIEAITRPSDEHCQQPQGRQIKGRGVGRAAEAVEDRDGLGGDVVVGGDAAVGQEQGAAGGGLVVVVGGAGLDLPAVRVEQRVGGR